MTDTPDDDEVEVPVSGSNPDLITTANVARRRMSEGTRYCGIDYGLPRGSKIRPSEFTDEGRDPQSMLVMAALLRRNAPIAANLLPGYLYKEAHALERIAGCLEAEAGRLMVEQAKAVLG